MPEKQLYRYDVYLTSEKTSKVPVTAETHSPVGTALYLHVEGQQVAVFREWAGFERVLLPGATT